MKFTKKFSILIVILTLTICPFDTLQNKAFLKSRSSALFSLKTKQAPIMSFESMSFNLKKDSMSDSINLSGVFQNEGFIVVRSEENKKEDLLTRVAELTTNDDLLIDYRLVNDCKSIDVVDGKTNTSIKNIIIKPLETQEKGNISFNIDFPTQKLKEQIESIKKSEENSSKFKFAEDDTLADNLGKVFKTLCLARKEYIANMKSNLSNTITTMKTKKSKLEEITKRIAQKEVEYRNISGSMEDTKNQITDMQKLENSYEQQLKSLNTLMTGTSKLIETEESKLKLLENRDQELKSTLEKLNNQLKENENKFKNTSEKYKDLLNKSKDLDMEIVKKQKKMSESEEKLNEVKSNRLQNKFDIEYKTKEISEHTDKIKAKENELKKLDLDETNLAADNQALNKSKENINSKASELRMQLDDIDKKINQLILEKNKKTDDIKNLTEQATGIDDKLSKNTVEQEKIRMTKNEVKLSKEKIEENLSNILQKKLSKLTNIKSLLDKEYDYYTDKINRNKGNIDDLENSKKSLKDELDNNSQEKTKLEQNLFELRKSISDMENTRNENVMNKKEVENKVASMRKNKENYQSDLDNIKHSLLSSQDSLSTYNGLNKEFSDKVSPIGRELENMKEEKKKLEGEIKSLRKGVKDTSQKFKSEAPSATIMLDMAEEDVLSSQGLKWRKLVDKIID